MDRCCFHVRRGTPSAATRCWVGEARALSLRRSANGRGTTDKIKGFANQAGGKVKESAGKALGSWAKPSTCICSLQAKGKVQRTIGEAKTAISVDALQRMWRGNRVGPAGRSCL
jgi:uncharacterized protein YjbJ (UPF0337 family)